MERRVKKLASKIAKDPWLAIEWKACHDSRVAGQVVELVDNVVFERDQKKALEIAYILRGLASRLADEHVSAKAEACLGTAFRLAGLFDLAHVQLEKARVIAKNCHDCLGEIHKRWGAVFTYEKKFEEALSMLDLALLHYERIDKESGRCSSLLNRSAVLRFVERGEEGLADLGEAICLLRPEMAPRYFVSAAVNALSLAASCDEDAAFERALSMIDTLRERIKGIRIHSRPRAVLRWIRGLAYEKTGDSKNAIRCIESAISTFERLSMVEEMRAALADLALIRRKGKQVETNNRHIHRLIEESLRLAEEPEAIECLEEARDDPSEDKILVRRSSISSYVPSLEAVETVESII